MAEVPTKRLKLEDTRYLSPPLVGEPLYQCAQAVVVYGFDVGATLDLERNGAIVLAGVPGGFPQPQGALLTLPAPLVAGDVIRARQKANGMTSGWSPAVTVRDHSQEYPDGPPRPQIDPAPVYQCGSRTGVDNLLTGCDVWVTADAVEVGKVKGAAPHQGVNVDAGLWAGPGGPRLGEHVRRRQPAIDRLRHHRPAQSSADAGDRPRLRGHPADPHHQSRERRTLRAVAERQLARRLANLGLCPSGRSFVAAQHRRHAIGRAADVPRQSVQQSGRYHGPAVLGAAGPASCADPVRRHGSHHHSNGERRHDQGLRQPREGRRRRRSRRAAQSRDSARRRRQTSFKRSASASASSHKNSPACASRLT